MPFGRIGYFWSPCYDRVMSVKSVKKIKLLPIFGKIGAECADRGAIAADIMLEFMAYCKIVEIQLFGDMYGIVRRRHDEVKRVR